jgi:hypothetical protein
LIPALRARSPPETCLELSFRDFLLVLILGQPKKSGNWIKIHASANQILESAEILIFSRKIPVLWARSPPETCLDLYFHLYFQPKRSKKSKKQTSVKGNHGKIN